MHTTTQEGCVLDKIKRLLTLWLTFMKIGLFTFGGGYAMIALIENECVEKKHWLTQEEMMDITVVAEATPGPIAINSSTYVGQKQAGFWGALCCTLGVVTPSFILLYLISLYFDRFLEVELIAHAFKGIKAAVAVLILRAGINMFSKIKKTVFSTVILVASLTAMLLINLFSWHFSTIYLLLIAGVISLAMFWVRRHVQTKGENR